MTRVLLVEDSPTDEKLIVAALRAANVDVDWRRVETPEALREALTEAWDIVLTDWSLPKLDALACIRIVKELVPDLPIVIVSGTVGEELAVEAVRSGAADYVLKDRLARLGPAVERELRDRKTRAQQAIEAARFRALIENSHDGISLTSADGTSLYMSPAAERILGVSASVRVGTNALSIAVDEDGPRLRAFHAALVRSPGGVGDLEFRIRRGDEVRAIQVTATNLLNDPNIGAIVANFRDVTERREAAARLRESELRFERLSKSGIIGIVIADSKGDVVEANDAFVDLLGYSQEEVRAGLLTAARIRPDDVRDTAQLLASLDANGAVAPVEVPLVHKDGSSVPVFLAAALLDSGRSIVLVADMRERERIKRALADSELQLRQAQKMEAVGRLAGGVAHDFNNILAVILSFSSFVLQDLKAGDPMRSDVEEIKKAGERAAGLVRQLLLFSRQQMLLPRVLDLNEVLGDLAKMLPRIVGEDIDLVVNPTKDLGRVFGDPTAIEQVLMNLVVNARDAMPTGGTLTIETANVALDDEYARTRDGARAGPHVMLAITDSGCGMDAATQAKIFDPFFTTKERGKGTGLGLSTVFGIVQQAGGSISVDSEVGRGTTFKIYLPRTDDVETPSAATDTTKLAGAGGTETVLLVEDDDAVRAVAKAGLKRRGYTVIEARNAGEALLHCEQHQGPIDLLLTDVVMPQMSGAALAQRLAVMRPSMKILFMSGYTDDSVMRHGVLEGSVSYLQKPFTPETLVAKVRAVLDAA